MVEDVVVPAESHRPFLARQLPLVKLTSLQAKFLCEGIGTFVLLMTISLAEMNCGLTAINGKTRTLNLAPVAQGFILCVMVFTFGYISGGHFNPAVTLGVVFVGCLRIEEAIAYWVAQLVGGLLGALFAILVNGTTRHLPAPQVYMNLPQYVFTAFITEALYTSVLVSVVLHVAYSAQRKNDFHGLAIGMCLLAAQYSVGGISRGSFNPAAATALQVSKFLVARYFIPLMHLWLYWAAPAVGAVIASVLFKMTHPAPKQMEGERQQMELEQSARNVYSD